MTINLILVVHLLLKGVRKVAPSKYFSYALLLLVLLAVVPFDLYGSLDILDRSPATVQTDTLSWIRQHVPKTAFVVINSYLYADLQVPGGMGTGGGATYPFAHVYFNVETDPAIYN